MTEAQQNITVRPAHPKDFPALTIMEEAVWKPEGTEVYGLSHFTTWMEIYPEGFLVAELTGQIIGFSFIQRITCDLSAPQWFGTLNEVSDNGYSRRTHRADGNYHYGVTICSQSPGGGKQLLRGCLKLCNDTKRPLLGTSRISGFSQYVANLENAGMITPESRERDLSAAALHYVIECVRMANGRMIPALYADYDPKRWPTLTEIDPVLKAYLRHPEFVMYRLLPAFWHDPKCLGYSVLFGQVNPL